MVELLKAEWQKIAGNRLLMVFTIGIFPLSAAGIVLMTLLFALMQDEVRVFPSHNWSAAALNVWRLFTVYPGNVLSGLVVSAFAAVTFASEYEGNTWKILIPRRPRPPVILSKFFVLTCVSLVVIMLTSVLWGAAMAVPATIIGVENGPPLNSAAATLFWNAFLLEIILVACRLLLLSSICMLAVLLTRTVVGGIMVGMSLYVVESVSGALLYYIGQIFDSPKMVNLYAIVPIYHSDNIRAWVLSGEPLAPGIAPGFTAFQNLPISIIALAGWISALISLNIWLFSRQDIS